MATAAAWDRASIDALNGGTGPVNGDDATHPTLGQVFYYNGRWRSETDLTGTIDDFEGTDGTINGDSGAVPAPTADDDFKFLRGDGAWADLPSDVYGAMSVFTPGPGGADVVRSEHVNGTPVATLPDVSTTDWQQYTFAKDGTKPFRIKWLRAGATASPAFQANSTDRITFNESTGLFSTIGTASVVSSTVTADTVELVGDIGQPTLDIVSIFPAINSLAGVLSAAETNDLKVLEFEADYEPESTADGTITHTHLTATAVGAADENNPTESEIDAALGGATNVMAYYNLSDDPADPVLRIYSVDDGGDIKTIENYSVDPGNPGGDIVVMTRDTLNDPDFFTGTLGSTHFQTVRVNQTGFVKGFTVRVGTSGTSSTLRVRFSNDNGANDQYDEDHGPITGDTDLVITFPAPIPVTAGTPARISLVTRSGDNAIWYGTDDQLNAPSTSSFNPPNDYRFFMQAVNGTNPPGIVKALGDQVAIDASAFTGNLDSTVQDVQILANAVDGLAAGVALETNSFVAGTAAGSSPAINADFVTGALSATQSDGNYTTLLPLSAQASNSTTVAIVTAGQKQTYTGTGGHTFGMGTLPANREATTAPFTFAENLGTGNLTLVNNNGITVSGDTVLEPGDASIILYSSDGSSAVSYKFGGAPAGNSATITVTATSNIASTTLLQRVNSTNNTTQTLPPANSVSSGQLIHVKRVGTGNVIVAPDGAETIDGSTASYNYNANNIFQTGSVTFISDGSGWHIV